MDHLQQLEIECPFCAETQHRETARWDELGLRYTTICQTCGKVFFGLTLGSAYLESSESSSSSSNRALGGSAQADFISQ
jgi:hypothetical protein